ncbi:MAG: serine/threonine protein kinase [Planctomycetota bacterium]|jgi:serine/threonine-protein kinase
MAKKGSHPNAGAGTRRLPSDPEEAAFCRQAESMGFLTPAQVGECTELQKRRARDGQNDPIAFILLEMGYLETDQIQKIRDAVSRGPAPPPSPPPRRDGEAPEYGSEEDDRKREELFSKLALKMGFISEEELKEVKALRAKGGRAKSDPLGFLLLDKGHLTSHQIRHINEEVKKTLGKPRIGGYELDTELGRGGMGVVFKARQLSLEREVALKVIPKTITASKDFKERFFREARTAAKLNHPNIVKAIDAGETARHFFFAMELIPGQTLMEVIRHAKKIPEKQGIAYAIQIAQALRHAHQHGLVHRDIKPENLLIDPESKQIKVTDLGLAKSTEEKDSAITQEGTTVGTPYYISPEQVAAKKDVDIRADLYALGGTLYHMLVGSPPFTAESPVLVIKKHLDEKPVAPKVRKPGLSNEINRIVMQLLEKERENRYPDPAALLEDLERLRRLGPEKAAAATGAKAPLGAAKSAAKRPKAKPFPTVPVVAGASALVALIIIVAIVAGGGGKGDGGGKSTASKDRTGDVDTSSPRESREKEARAALERAHGFAEKNPNRFDRILANYREVLERYRRTAAFAEAQKAIRDVETRRNKRTQMVLEDRKTVARRLAEKEDFRAALDALDEFPRDLRNAEVDAALREEADGLRDEAARAQQIRVDRAAASAVRGRLDEAIETLKGVEKFGMPGLFEKVEPLIAKYEKEKKTSAFRSLHLRVLDRIAASDLTGGRQFLQDELRRTQDYELKDLLRRDILNIAKAETVWRSVLVRGPSRKGVRPVRLNTGEVLLAEIQEAGGKLRLKGPEGERTIAVSGLAAPEIRAITGGASINLACFAWYVNRDLRYLLELTGGETEGPGELEGLARLALICSRTTLQSELDAMASGVPDPSRLYKMLRQWGGIPQFTAQEDEVRLLAARTLNGVNNPFVFATGPGRDTKGTVRLAYDFGGPFAFDQFLTAGKGAWKAGWGALAQEARGSGQVQAFLPGVWTSFNVEMSVLMDDPVQGVGFTFHQRPNGDRYAFEARKRGGKLCVAFYFRPPACPAMFLLGAPHEVENFIPEKFHTMGLSVKDGVFLGSLGEAKVRVGPDDRKGRTEDGHRELASGRLGIRASSPVTIRRLSVEGTPEFTWASSLSGPKPLETLKATGTGTLFDGTSPKGWEVLTGTARVRNRTFALEGPMSAITHASGSLFDGRKDMQIAFEARRVSGVAYLLVGFRFGRIPRLLAVRPAKGDPYPKELPPGVRLVDAPVGDGQWHRFMLMEGPEGASLWVDRVKRFLIDAKDIDKWDESRFHLWGLGFGSAGGAWEIRNMAVTRKSF